MLSSASLRRALPALSAALPIIIISVTALSVVFAAAEGLDISAAQAASWIVALYGIPGVLSLWLSMRYRQPLILTGNIFALIFIASLGGQLSYPELVGASVVAGAIVVLVGALGLTGRLAAWIPAPIVLGLVAGAVMPYIAGIFTALGDEPVLVGGAFLAYLLGRRIQGPRLPAILPALIAGLALAGLTGHFGPLPTRMAWPIPIITLPTFSLHAIATATPVLVVLITIQGNLPSVIFMQSQGYAPPERVINAVSGGGTLVGSLLDPMALSIAVLLTPLTAGPDAGDREVRHWSVYISASAFVLIALLAGVAADLPVLIPLPLLLALAGLSLVGVLASTLQQITRGPLLLGPMFAFAIALSRISLLGLGPFFWSLVFGMGISLLLEQEALKRLRASVSG